MYSPTNVHLAGTERYGGTSGHHLQGMEELYTTPWGNGLLRPTAYGNGTTVRKRILYSNDGATRLPLILAWQRERVRLHQEYHYTEDVDQLPDEWVPANTVCFLGEVVHRRSIGTPIATTVLETPTFWEFLKSLGGEWMWDYIQEGKTDVYVSWVSAALIAGTFISVTDGFMTAFVQVQLAVLGG
jgi:hypothetical protein